MYFLEPLYIYKFHGNNIKTHSKEYPLGEITPVIAFIRLMFVLAAVLACMCRFRFLIRIRLRVARSAFKPPQQQEPEPEQ